MVNALLSILFGEIQPLIVLIFFAFFAGAVDSIAGGGGLIQFPAFLLLYPSLPVSTIMGTNKLGSFFGTSVAAFQYYRQGKLPIETIWPAIPFAFVGAFMGALCISFLNPSFVKPLVIFLLVLVLIFLFIKPKIKEAKAPVYGSKAKFFAVFIGFILGFYDGFFGPGTGSFLVMAFSVFLSFTFIQASASAKLVNMCTNIAALTFFMSTNQVIYKIAFPLACSNMMGAYLGAKLAIRKGDKLVKWVLAVVSGGLIIKLSFF